jgi:hypothetical protein
MLPVQSRPGYSAGIALDRLNITVRRVEKILAPRLWRKLLGAASKDHARAVVAACNEESKAIRIIFQEAKKHARISGANPAIDGSLERVIKLMDQWREVGLEFEEAEFGSDQRLLSTTRRLITLCNDLKNPASGLQ